MTRAGNKLYREADEPRGSVLWALVTHPQFRRGFRATARLALWVLLALWCFGLG